MADAPADGIALRCPGCGYDVRFAADSRCSECGRVFDRQRLERTWWPWVHRREMGRVRAFFKTMIAVMFLPFRARDQVFGVLTLGDAWRFWWWCGVVILGSAAALSIGLPWLIWGRLGSLWVKDTNVVMRALGNTFPMWVGVMTPGALFLAALFACWLAATVLRACFQTSRAGDELQRESAAAMGVYQVVYVLPVLISVVPMVLLVVFWTRRDPQPVLMLVAAVLPGAVAGWGLFCIGRMQTLVSGRGRLAGTITGAVTAVLVGSVAVVAIVLPLWLIGLWRIMVESFW